jgi:predicted alpha-1,6-mannanase (GH76 family)
MYKIIFLFCYLIVSNSIFAINKPNPYIKDFQKDVNKMMDFYSPKIKFWQDKNCIHTRSCQGHEQGLWYWAQAAMILANYQEQTGDKKYASQLKSSYTSNWHYIINNNYYDDRLWWALALIKIYQVNKDMDALDKAQLLVTSVVKQGLQNVCHGSGGIYWNAAKTQVGSISNTMLITAAGRLYLITHDLKYKDIANQTWQWLQLSGLLDSNHNLADNYTVNNQKQCGKLTTWHTTYNDGMLLGAASTLELINGQKELRQYANNIARKSLYEYSKGGIIEEICTNAYACAEDGYMFKGIFVYNLALHARYSLIDIYNIKQQLAYNYAVLLNKQNGAGIYAFNWSLPVNFKRDDGFYNPADIVTFISALYLELANVILN